MSFTQFAEKEEEPKKFDNFIYEVDLIKKTKLNRRGSQLLEKLNKIDIHALRENHDGPAKIVSGLRKGGGEKIVSNWKWGLMQNIFALNFFRCAATKIKKEI